MMATHQGYVIRAALAVAALVWAATAATATAAGAGDDAVERRIRAIKSPSSQRKWQQIPWSTDLAESLRTARQERRPIFLWVTGDDPLERC